MARLKYGQIDFTKMLPLRTCHDIRLWRCCPVCGALGDKNSMIQSGTDGFWHGRCFVKRFGLERLLEMPRSETLKLTLGDLGVDLMSQLLAGVDTREAR